MRNVMPIQEPADISDTEAGCIKGRRCISFLLKDQSHTIFPLLIQNVAKQASFSSMPVPIMADPWLATVNHRELEPPFGTKRNLAMSSFGGFDVIVRQI